MKAFKLIDQYLQLLEQDEVEEIDASVDVEVEETPSPGEIAAADLLTGAFVWNPTEEQRTSIEELSFRFSDRNPRMVIKSVVMYLPDELKTVYAEGPARGGWGDITPEGEIYLAKLMASAFVYSPDPNDIKIANQSMKTLGVINPRDVIEEIERLLQFSDEGLEQDLENLEDEEIQGDENTPQEQREVEYTVDRIKELIDQIKLDQNDPVQMKKLYDRIATFEGYRPIKETLTQKGFKEKELGKYSGEIMALIEDQGRDDKLRFFEFLEKGSTIPFPDDPQGNVYDLINHLEFSSDLATQIFMHTGQDASKRGVGMGELALALLFQNIDAAGGVKSKAIASADKKLEDLEWKPRMNVRRLLKSKDPDERKRGEAILAAKDEKEAATKFGIKGDLELNGKEFEIKGENAALGETSDAQYGRVKSQTNKSLKDMGIGFVNSGGIPLKPGTSAGAAAYTVNDERLQIKEGKDNLGRFPLAVSTAYSQSDDQPGFQKIFKEFLTTSGGFGGEVGSSVYNDMMQDLSRPGSVQRGIAALNLLRYTKKEGFKYFMAHDIGTDGTGVGKYVYAEGKPHQIAETIRDNPDILFERVTYNGLRPRIGFKSTMVYEDNEIVEKI